MGCSILADNGYLNTESKLYLPVVQVPQFLVLGSHVSPWSDIQMDTDTVDVR